jgi:hypothetical protein
MARLHRLAIRTAILWNLTVFGSLEHHQVSGGVYLYCQDIECISISTF